MTPRYPGARFLPSSSNGNRCYPRACSWHEAVTTAGVEQLGGWATAEDACHGFTGEDGDCGQFAEFDEAVNGVKDDNGSVLTWENWDGLVPRPHNGHPAGTSPDGSFGPNDRGFTAQQKERNADIMAWMAYALGIPLRLMQWTNEHGHGPHRLGVRNPTGRVRTNTGPASWTRHDGKECPGDIRVQELPGIIARAVVILAAVRAGRCTWLPTGPVNLAAALARTGAPVPPVKPTPPKLDEDENIMRTLSVAGYHPVIGYGPGLFIHLNGGQLNEGKRLGQIGAGGVTTLARADEVQAWAESFGAGPKNVKGKASAYIKARPSTPVTPPVGRTYTVVSGDTFDAIARKYGVTPDALAAANPAVKNRSSINVGQVLNIPK